MGLPLNDDLQSRVLVGEIYRYEDEYGVVYYLLDNASGKKFLLDYEPYKNENSESPSTK